VRVLAPAKLVLAIAEQREVIRCEPVEERARFVAQGIRRAAARGELLPHLGESLEHRLPVLDGGANVGERAAELGLDLLEDRAVRLPRDLDVDERLDA